MLPKGWTLDPIEQHWVGVVHDDQGRMFTRHAQTPEGVMAAIADLFPKTAKKGNRALRRAQERAQGGTN